jgi:hypothetical protein
MQSECQSFFPMKSADGGIELQDFAHFSRMAFSALH